MRVDQLSTARLSQAAQVNRIGGHDAKLKRVKSNQLISAEGPLTIPQQAYNDNDTNNLLQNDGVLARASNLVDEEFKT